MKTLTLLIAIMMPALANAQMVVEWKKTYGGTQADAAYDICQSSDGGYVFVGYSLSADGDVTKNNGKKDFWIVKVNDVGTITWQRSLGGSDDETAYSVKQTTDGGYVVAGYARSNNGDVTGHHGSSDVWVVKLDVSGNLVWQNAYGGSGNESALSIEQTSDGGFIVAGQSSSSNGDLNNNYGDVDVWLLKLDSAGNLVWQKSLGGSKKDYGRRVYQTTDGGYIAAGFSESNDFDLTVKYGDYDYWVIKLDAAGTIVWQTSLGGSKSDKAFSMQRTLGGGYVLAGESSSINGDVTGNHGLTDFWLTELDSTGVIIWETSLGGTSAERAESVAQKSNGGYIVCGWTYSNDGDITSNNGEDDYWVAMVENSGSLTWQETYGGSSRDWANGLRQTSEGGYVIAGMTESTDGDVSGNHGVWDVWVIKLAFNTGMYEPMGGQNIRIAPVPVAGSAVISWNSEKLSANHINIYNIAGQIVHSYGNLTNGSYYFDRTGLGSGIYFVEIESKDGMYIRKKIILQ